MRRGRTFLAGLSAPRVPSPAVAAAAYAVVTIVLLWPALSGQRVLVAASDLYLWAPWHSSQPEGLHDYLNPLLSDQTRSFYPWLSYARDQLHAGHLPQWNPFALSGTPFLANGQSQLFSVFSLPVWLLPLDYGLAVSAAMRLWVAAMGAFVLARQLKLGFWPCLLAGFAFGLSPFLLIWLYHPISGVVAMLPWGLVFAERVARGGGRWDVAGLAVAVALMNLSGYPAGQAHVCLGIVIYTAARVLTVNHLGWTVRAARLGLVILGIVLGAMLVAFVLLPVALAIPGTAGVEIRAGGGGSVPLSGLRTLFFPDWWGRPSGAAVDGPGTFAMRDAYVGAVPLMLATVALLHRDDWRRKLPFALLAFIGLAIAFGVQPFHWLITHTPPFDHSINKLLIMLADMGGAILAAIGLEQVLRMRRPDPRTIVVAVAGLAAAAVAVVALHPGTTTLKAVERHFRTGDTIDGAAALAVISVTWWALFAIGFALLVVFRRWLPVTAMAAALSLLVVADAAHVFRGYQPMVPEPAVFPTTDALRFLQQHVGGWRMIAVAPAMPADTGTVYGLRDARGLDPPQPSTAYFRLLHLERPDARLRASTQLNHVTDLGARALSMLSVRYVMAGGGGPLSGLTGFTSVYRGEDAAIFENRQAVPRASVPVALRSSGSEEDALAMLRSPGFTPGRDAVTDRPVAAGSGTARVTGDSAEQVTIQADMRARGLVVLADQWSSGWTVTVDGRDQRPVRVNAALRGVVVERGTHTVVWRYRTPGLVAGTIVSVTTLLLGSVFLVLAPARRRPPLDAPATAGR